MIVRPDDHEGLVWNIVFTLAARTAATATADEDRYGRNDEQGSTPSSNPVDGSFWERRGGRGRCRFRWSWRRGRGISSNSGRACTLRLCECVWVQSAYDDIIA